MAQRKFLLLSARQPRNVLLAVLFFLFNSWTILWSYSEIEGTFAKGYVVLDNTCYRTQWGNALSHSVDFGIGLLVYLLFIVFSKHIPSSIGLVILVAPPLVGRHLAMLLVCA